MAHKACTFAFHMLRSETSRRAVFQELHPALFLSTSTSPCCLWSSHLPSSFPQSSTLDLQHIHGSFRNMWPIQFYLHLLISPLILVASAFSCTVRFEMHWPWGSSLGILSGRNHQASFPLSSWVSMSHIHITIRSDDKALKRETLNFPLMLVTFQNYVA